MRRLRGHLTFSFTDDLGHHADGLARILSACSFSRKHYSIAAIEDRIGYVAGLSARGPRVFDHRLKHLRGRNHWLAPCGGTPDHMFLDYRDLLRRHFYAKIAARHHHAVGNFEYLLKMFDRLRLLQLRDYPDIATEFADLFPNSLHIGCRSNKGYSNNVHTVCQSELEILL